MPNHGSCEQPLKTAGTTRLWSKEEEEEEKRDLSKKKSFPKQVKACKERENQSVQRSERFALQLDLLTTGSGLKT